MSEEYDFTECDAVLSRIYAFLDGEASEEAADEIRHHLDACEHCLDQADVAAAIKAMVQRCCAPPPAPETLRQSLYARYHVESIEIEVRHVELRIDEEIN